MAMGKGKGQSLRQWQEGSYDSVTGRSHSSLNNAGSPGNHCKNADKQIPDISGRDKSGSGVGSKSRGSTVP